MCVSFGSQRCTFTHVCVLFGSRRRSGVFGFVCHQSLRIRNSKNLATARSGESVCVYVYARGVCVCVYNYKSY